MCNRWMGECVYGGNCNQRCLIVECWLNLIVDVRALDFNCDLGLRGVIMFIFACSNHVYRALGMHASFDRATMCTVEAD